MKITVVGGGPGGLYFAILTKKQRPDWTIEVFEQNRDDDTFGFGVVFSDDTLDEFLSRDVETYEKIRDQFAYWDDIAVHMKGEEIRCAGNGFCGTSRFTLLKVLHERATELGIELNFSQRIDPETLQQRFADSDIIVASDGINSPIREHFKKEFAPSVTMKSNRFCWMGSSRPMDEFNYFFRETDHGIVCAHTYQYEQGRSTWVFEMSDECWQGHGFEEFDEEGSRDKLANIFETELQGHGLLLNRSNWRQFPRIFCENWSHENIVILGDAKASAHFSIGSGTKLAMECGIALADAVLDKAESSVPEAFAAYDALRRVPCQVIQHNADVSLAWFEHMDRNWDMDPIQFAMVVMCRAKSITYDNLILRDPTFIEAVDTAWYQRYFEETGLDYRQSRPTPMFTPFKLRDMVVENRVVMSPMAQYSAEANGNLTDWHFVHYSGHALGGMGLMVTEMTCPSADARITQGCPGIWTDEQEAQWRRIVQFVHAHSASKICMQLGHAGRKGSTQLGWQKMDHPLESAEQNWPIVSASPIPYLDGISQVPAQLDELQMRQIRDDFVRATERAANAGFDMIELHCAHGYLLGAFLSPLTNRRDDSFGGSIENRLRFPLDVFKAMREAWPQNKPMSVRVSATDWHEDGLDEADLFAIARAFEQVGCDLVDVSAGQTVEDQKPVYGRMFQAQFAEAVRNTQRVATMAVGNITEAAQVNTLLHTRRADLVAMARPHLWDPTFAHKAAAAYGAQGATWPLPYLSGRDQAYRELQKARSNEIELRQKARPSQHVKAD